MTAAKKKKPAKSGEGKFLSRASIEERRKRAARWARLKEILGVALVVLTVAAIISLLSHNPQDRSFNSSTSNPHFQNYLGSFGAYFSDLLIQGFGFGAYFFPLFSFLLALTCFVPLVTGWLPGFIRAGSLMLFCLSVVSLGSLAFSRDPVFKWVPPGGLVGSLTSDALVLYLNRTGTALALFFLLLTSLLIAANVTLKNLSHTSWKAVLRGWKKIRQHYEIAQVRSTKAKTRRQSGAEPALPSAEPRIVDHAPPPQPRRSRPPVKQEKFEFAKKSGAFEVPSLTLLDDPPAERSVLSREELIANSRILEKKLMDFGVTGRVTEVRPGPVITMYEFEPSAGVKVNRIISLEDDLALAMSALSVRAAPIPGKSVVGIEIPNHRRELVCLKEIMLSDSFRKNRSKLAVSLGKDIFGKPTASDLIKMPHILIAGATGTGKSVMINSMISSILFNASPEEVQFLMIDPKMVELTTYDGIPHLIAPVVSNPKKAAYALRNAIGIMEERFKTLADVKVRNIESYNRKIAGKSAPRGNGEEPPKPMPYLVIVIDELADLMILAQNEVEDSITRLAQMSRAVGIHLMIATQRPSTNVITGIIKANLPVRISFQVSSKIDSRVVLDGNGAEQLLGKGDMLFLPPGMNRLQRLHGAYISESEVNRLVEHLKNQADPEYDESILQPPPVEEKGDSDGEEDEMYDQAVALVTKSGQASISFLQRKLRVGYNRAARMIEAMEQAGLLGPAEGSRPRKVLARRNYDD